MNFLEQLEQVGEYIEFEVGNTEEEIKSLLKNGKTVLLTEIKSLYFSKAFGRLYLIEGQPDGDETLEDLDPYDLEAREISIEDGQKEIEEFLKEKEREADRRKKYEEWLS